MGPAVAKAARARNAGIDLRTMADDAIRNGKCKELCDLLCDEASSRNVIASSDVSRAKWMVPGLMVEG